MELTRLPDAELEVMQALWRLEVYPVSSGDIMAGLTRSWKLPTLLKLLSRLEERGFVSCAKDGRANLYRPMVRQGDYLAAETGSFFSRLHGGSLPSLVAALAESRSLTQRQLDELHAILDCPSEGGDLS